MQTQTKTCGRSFATNDALLSAAYSQHWLSVLTHIDPRFGGLSAAVPALARRVADAQGFRTSVAAFCEPDEQYVGGDLDAFALSRWPSSRLVWMRNRALTTCFYNLLSSADGIHIHGLWEHSSLLAARYARAKRIPYVVSAHGMLERWALANKRLKKTVYSALIERENLLGAGCLIALTKKEAEDYRRYGARRPIAVIPNGVEIPEQISAERFHAVYPELAGKRIVLFLGRIHYKKGLDLLIRAWKGISRKYRDTHLVIAGPDSEGMQAQAEQQIAEEQIGDRVLFTGMLRGEMKWSALAAAECFVLPSRSEGFSVSVLEAMGASLPVIVTNACNVPEIATEEAGIVVPVDARRLESALRLILNNASAANRHIGARGRRLVRQKYDWASIGAQMSEVYAWVQGGPAPRSVEIMPA